VAESPTQYAEQLLTVVNDTARTVSTRFVTFLTVGVYVAVTIASTTDEMLVKGSLVTLPLLNTQIPISGWFGFYTVAPWLLVALHLDLLLQMSWLGAKLAEFDAELTPLTPEQRRHFHTRLPGFYYVQFLVGAQTSRLRRGLAGLIVCSSMIVFPLVLLCWMQARFLAVHDPRLTTIHKLAVIADIGVVLVFLWRPLGARTAPLGGEARRTNALRGATVAVCAAVLVFCLSASIPQAPGERSAWLGSRNLDLRQRVLTSLPEEAINALGGDDVGAREEALRKVSRLNFLQGRDLRYANFFNAVLPRADLRSPQPAGTVRHRHQTQLQNADLQWTQMQEVLLDDANLRQAKLCGAQLQGSSLARSDLEAADLSAAQLQAAQLREARLDGAVLVDARLQGADLSNAFLRGAHLSGAQMQGAFLRGAVLQGADLSGAVLQGADLSNAQLAGANLRGAQLQGAVLCGAYVAGADFSGAALDLAATDRVQAGYSADRSGVPVDACAPAQEPGSLISYLADLSCSDPYVARALSSQAAAAVNREQLAGALLARAEAEDVCSALKLLPSGARAALRQQAADAAAAGGGAAS
jgi:uncharacterized protein YjbI with pentapeptide repeats